MLSIIKQLLSAAVLSVMVFSAVITTTLATSRTANAQAISQAQIEQFKKLPRAQQEMLARQYGFDLSLLNSGQSNSAANSASEQPQVVKSRDNKDTETRAGISPKALEEYFAAGEPSQQPFGYKLFAGEPSTFAPVSHAPVPANYQVGVGDTISVQLYGKESQNHELTVNRQGTISIPDLGPLQVVGLTFTDVQNLIKSEVANRMIGMQAAVSMGQLRSIQVYVMGEAYQPGTYTVSSLTTVMQALIVSGGVSDIASLRNIQLKRGGKTIETIDLYDFLIHGDASNDRILHQGDIVFIPARGDIVTVKGEVLRPAMYELTNNERTLADMIELAGGLKANAYANAVSIERFKNGQRVVETVNYANAKSLTLRDGDSVNIHAISTEINQSVMLVGAVARPGYYQWRDGLTINNVLTNLSSSLLNITDLTYGLVVREKNAQRDIEVIQFNLANAIAGHSDDNIELKQRDQIVVFSKYENSADEKRQLNDWLLTESERDRQEREKLLAEYKRKYYRDLAGVRVKQNELSDKSDSSEVAGELQGLFARASGSTPDEQISEYSQYSRNSLLEPVLAKLRNQFSAESELPLVKVIGQVRYPGIYPLAENATEKDLIEAAGGFKESAYLDRAEITRSRVVNGETVTDYVTINLRDSLRQDGTTVLKGRDSLHVFQIPEWQNTVEVQLDGEVRFPGIYTVRRGETLSALIQRAGGFTDYAFPQGAIFTRVDLKQLERKRMRTLAQQLQQEIATNSITGTENSTRSYSETRQLLNDLTSVEPVGRLIIDLPQIVAGGLQNDIELKDGDRLVIPTTRNTVNIIGEVQMASSYVYDGSLSAHDYIRKAGGIRKKADEDRIFIVKSNGSIEMLGDGGWFGLGNSKRLEPGDTIVVPLDTQYKDGLTVWTQATQIVYQVGVALAALAAI